MQEENSAGGGMR